MGLHLFPPYTLTAGAGRGSRANAGTQAPGAFHSVLPHPPPESWSKPCHRHKMVTFGALGEGARQSLKEPAPHPLPSRTRRGAEGDVSAPQQRLQGLPAKSEQRRTGGQTTPPPHPKEQLKMPSD